MVRLFWEEGHKQVSWEPVSGEVPSPAVSSSYEHQYFVAGSWIKAGSTWTRSVGMESMIRNDEGLYEYTFTVGGDGFETFQFVRDRDWNQVIYPATNRTEKTSVPVRGPDDAACGKMFLISSYKGEQVHLAVSVTDGRVVVTATSPMIGEKIWESASSLKPMNTYSITGDFNDWSLSPMTSTDSGVFTYRLSIGQNGEEDFQIIENSEWSMVLHPMTADA